MLQPICRIEEAFRDTLVHKAEGRAFDALAGFYGFRRLTTFSTVANWRKALRLVALGPRGTPAMVVGALEGALTAQSRVYAVNLHPASPFVATYVSGPNGGFKRQDVRRLCRIAWSAGSFLYWSSNPSFVTDPNLVSPTIAFADFKAGFWKKADWSSLAGQESATLTILPFVVKDCADPCVVEVLVEALTTSPPTYLQPDDGLRPAGQPWGGHLLADATKNGNLVQTLALGAAPGDPYGIYLDDGVAADLAAVLDGICAAGVQVKARYVDFSALDGA